MLKTRRSYTCFGHLDEYDFTDGLSHAIDISETEDGDFQTGSSPQPFGRLYKTKTALEQQPCRTC